MLYIIQNEIQKKEKNILSSFKSSFEDTFRDDLVGNKQALTFQ